MRLKILVLQLLQSQEGLVQSEQGQVKSMNQAIVVIHTRMESIFTELRTKYNDFGSHMKRIYIQLAQNTETVKKQQETLPGKTVMNPMVEHCIAI